MLVGTLVNISTNTSIQYPHWEFPAEYLPWDAYNRGGGGGGGDIIGILWRLLTTAWEVSY